jgi:hypothetical protein
MLRRVASQVARRPSSLLASPLSWRPISRRSDDSGERARRLVAALYSFPVPLVVPHPRARDAELRLNRDLRVSFTVQRLILGGARPQNGCTVGGVPVSDPGH